jgi:ribosomal protein S18 acetylase RimI-like enzyme
MEHRIEAYLRAAGSIGRLTEQVGPFFATLTESTDNPYLSYAIPDDGARPTPQDVVDLVAFYRSRGRRPRLEYVAGLAPYVEPTLVAGGFDVEGRLPLMAASATTIGRSSPPGIEVVVPRTKEDVEGLVTVLADAYGDPVPTTSDVERRRDAIATGAIALVARDTSRGVVVGGGSCSRIIDGLTEVAGIGVSPEYRRRGIARALAERLAARAIECGATTPFLMAAHEAEARIYRRAGFSQVGVVLHLSQRD